MVNKISVNISHQKTGGSAPPPTPPSDSTWSGWAYYVLVKLVEGLTGDATLFMTNLFKWAQRVNTSIEMNIGKTIATCNADRRPFGLMFLFSVPSRIQVPISWGANDCYTKGSCKGLKSLSD